ncbi:MAG: metal ABC transporter substrate-binding protein [Candidatus Latescibacterota bacterium]
MMSTHPLLRRPAPVLAAACVVLAPLVAGAELDVVATTPDLAAIAQAVGGERVRVASIARPSEDPHFVNAKPSHVVRLRRADVLIEGGAELELGWLGPLLEGARNARLLPGAPGRVSGARGVPMLEVPATLDRSRGDIHAAGNPHYLVDPLNARLAAETLADAFARLDPNGAGLYRERVAAFQARLDARLEEWQRRLAPYRGRRIVAYHNTWPYFARRFGLRIDLFLEPKPGIPPTPAHLAGVLATMQAEDIGAIVVEPYQNRRTAATIARDTGATVVDLTQYPGGVKGTEAGYIEMMDYLVEALAQALAGART